MTATRPVGDPIDLADADRLAAVLLQASEISLAVDPLGPIGTRLRDLGPALRCLSGDLHRAIVGHSDGAGPPATDACALRRKLEHLGTEVGRLVEAARAAGS